MTWTPRDSTMVKHANEPASPWTFANLSITLNSGDPLPVVRLSSQEDVLDETGTVELKVSLSDSYSSSKLDMIQGSKSDFYYLGDVSILPGSISQETTDKGSSVVHFKFQLDKPVIDDLYNYIIIFY